VSPSKCLPKRVAEWVKSRVTKGRGKYEIRASMGIAERTSPSDNAVFTNMSARTILLDAISAAKRMNRPVDPAWPEIATKLVIPKRGKVVISHDAFRVDEEKAATPDPLMGIFPLGCDFDQETGQATLAYYLKIAKRYIGSPMLSALYGVWAARSGNRRLSLEMLDRGYEATVISAPADLCKRWNTAKTYFRSNLQPDRSLQI
jgi:trehalose/maltose hydrolase-like predicted phosphorylase